MDQTIVFLTEQQLADRYSELNESETAVSHLTKGEIKRLAELAALRGTVEVYRDWEGSLMAWPTDESCRESLGIDCVLCISPHGGIAHYNVNQPRYFESLAMLKDYLRKGLRLSYLANEAGAKTWKEGE